MPNYMYGKLKFEGDPNDIDALKNHIRSADSVFDFNTLIPMPDSLNITDGSMTSDCIIAYLRAVNPHNPFIVPNHPKILPTEFDNLVNLIIKNGQSYWTDAINKDPSYLQQPVQDLKSIDTGKIYVDNLVNYGHMTWYSWRCEHWNTKWNACDSEYQPDGTLTFSTAWAAPMPVIDELARKFPNVKIRFEYCEEFIGSCVGLAEYENGSIINDVCYNDCSREAIEMACEFTGCTPDDLNMILDPYTNTYISKDDIQEFISVPKLSPCVLTIRNIKTGTTTTIRERIPDTEREKIIERNDFSLWQTIMT